MTALLGPDAVTHPCMLSTAMTDDDGPPLITLCASTW